MTEIEPKSNPSNTPPLIDFPCDFQIKVVGETQNAFPKTIISLIQKILPEFNSAKINSRVSSTGKYTSLTCTVYVTSQEQLDDIYRLISAHPMVKFSL
jgi:putative lipoic acid-binding regulatory protein